MPHRLLQQPRVEVKADGGDVAALLRAEQVARPTDLQVTHGDAESRAKLGGLLDSLQALLGLLGHGAVALVEEVGVGPVGRAPDPPTQLVELGQAVVGGVVNDDRIGVGYVQSALDDRRADQHIVATLEEVEHHPFKLALSKLTVAHTHVGLGHDVAQMVRHMVDALHPVMHEVDLTLTLKLAQDRLADERLVIGQHVGLDRHAILGRSVDHAQVTDARHRHVQGTRDRCGREGEDINFGAQMLEPLFVAHPEALLLVHHHQAQVFEGDVLAQNTVSSDDDVNFPTSQILQDDILLLRRAEAREHLDDDGKGSHAPGEGVKVLLGEDGGGHQNRHLLPVLHGLKGGAQGHLRLTKADIPTDQAIHGYIVFHIGLNLGECAQLVVGFDIGEGTLQFALPLVIGGEGVAALGLALGVEGQQILGEILDGGAGLALGALPVLGTQAGEGRRTIARTDIAGHPVDLIDRHIDLIAGGVAQYQILALDLADSTTDHALVDGDAMFNMDNVIPNLEPAQEGGAILGAAGSAAVLGERAALAHTKDLSVSVEGQSEGGQPPASFQRTVD